MVQELAENEQPRIGRRRTVGTIDRRAGRKCMRVSFARGMAPVKASDVSSRSRTAPTYVEERHVGHRNVGLRLLVPGHAVGWDRRAHLGHPLLRRGGAPGALVQS